jgi:threonine synthase
MGVAAANRVSLGEGSTPLVPAGRIAARLGLDLHLKLECLNPTGSFKDRGMAVAVSRALDRGAHTVVCASTGNTAASAAAYAARAGLEAVVITPVGATADAKRAQARAVGAHVVEINGSFDEALRLCRELGERDGFAVVNSVNPDRIDGQKTVVAEIVEQLGTTPDVIALPYGGGGNTSAVAAGIADAGISTRIVSGQSAVRTTTVASAIRIGEPAHQERVEGLATEGRVEIATLGEEELLSVWRELGEAEGIFCEPASAAGIAALAQLGVAGVTAVAIITGHGLKDTGRVDDPATAAVEPTVEAVLEAIK